MIKQYAVVDDVVAAESVRPRADIDELKSRLGELQSMVEAIDPRPQQRSSKVKAADHLLAEMSEQLRLQKELHLRRKVRFSYFHSNFKLGLCLTLSFLLQELEELMKKDILDSMQNNHHHGRALQQQQQQQQVRKMLWNSIASLLKCCVRPFLPEKMHFHI